MKQTNKQTNKVLLVKQTNNIAEHCSCGGGNKRSHASLATAGEERITKQTEIKKYWRKKRKGQRSEYVLISMPFTGNDLIHFKMSLVIFLTERLDVIVKLIIIEGITSAMGWFGRFV